MSLMTEQQPVPVHDLEVVVPVYNEERRLPDTLASLVEHLERLPLTSLITVVDNGSVDRTSDVVAGVADDGRVPIRLLGCAQQGKGAAVRRGMLSSTARWVGFCDADLATPVHAIDGALARLRDGVDVVIGSRRCEGASMVIRQPLARRVGSRGFRSLTRSLVGEVSDSQCGFKFFTADAARVIFSRTQVDGFAFDLEVLALSRRHGLAVAELPVDWTDREGSTFSVVLDTPKVFRDVQRVRRSLAVS